MTFEEAIEFVQLHSEIERTKQLAKIVQDMNEIRQKGREGSEKVRISCEKRLETRLQTLRQYGRDVSLVKKQDAEVYVLNPVEEELQVAHAYMREEYAKDLAEALETKERDLRGKITTMSDHLTFLGEICFHFPFDDVGVEGLTRNAIDIELLHKEVVTLRKQLRLLLGQDPESPVKKF